MKKNASLFGSMQQVAYRGIMPEQAARHYNETDKKLSVHAV